MIRSLRKFWTDQSAAVAIEAVIITPILAWLFVASFVFFDAFRTYNTSIKATYSMADVLSRQTESIRSTDIEGLSDIFQFMTRNTSGTAMRVSQITRRQNGHRIDWSHATDGRTRLRDADLADREDNIPVMAFGDRLLLVETFLPYVPAFTVGVGEQEFTNFTVTRPRFAGQVPFIADLPNSYVYTRNGTSGWDWDDWEEDDEDDRDYGGRGWRYDDD